jgi:ubiquitin-conjugating enzyme (huntingtin interacting protein 2)
VAAHYKRDKQDFEQTAKYWTEVYANPNAETLPDGVTPDAVTRLVDMGFERSNVIR